MRCEDFVRGKNRTHCITTRMNDEELEELKRRKGNVPYGVYVRWCCWVNRQSKCRK